MELLDIVDENGVPTGQTVERALAHRTGARHRTAHVWLARLRGGEPELLLQKRSESKDSHPGCYDISSAGHIPAGEDVIPSALRELREELGLEVPPQALLPCGLRRFTYRGEFHGAPFFDCQVSHVFVLRCDVEPETLRLQPEEVADVRWVPFSRCLAMAHTGEPGNCIRTEELRMIAPLLEQWRDEHGADR